MPRNGRAPPSTPSSAAAATRSTSSGRSRISSIPIRARSRSPTTSTSWPATRSRTATTPRSASTSPPTSRSSYAFALDATHFGYSDENTNRTPRTTVVGEAQWALEFTPVLSGTLLGNYFYYTADNDAETEIREAEVDVGVIFEPTEVLQPRRGHRLRQAHPGPAGRGETETVQDDAGPVAARRPELCLRGFRRERRGRAIPRPRPTRGSRAISRYPIPCPAAP